MLNQQTKKQDNQRKAMRHRERVRDTLQQERLSLIHRVAEQTRVIREQRTDSKDRDGYETDLRSSSFMRESRRLRALQGRLTFVTDKLARINY